MENLRYDQRGQADRQSVSSEAQTATPRRPRVLVVDTGGTISQKPTAAGALGVSDAPILDQVPEIRDIADITLDDRFGRRDSTEMDTSYRAAVATLIAANASAYDGFVILHGTDTMAETAAALTYMVQDLGKPIILTGSQLPIFQPGTDAKNNLYYAVKAATSDIGEVAIAFGSTVLRGSRAIKQSENQREAFASPRTAPIAEIGLELILASHRIPRGPSAPHLFTQFSSGVESYMQTSGSSTDVLGLYANAPTVDGAVVGGFGAGNVQSRLYPSIEEMTKAGKPVVVTTMCQRGSAEMDLYEVGTGAKKAGAICGHDLTREAAAQKLMYAIGVAKSVDDDPAIQLELVRSIMTTPIAQDMTPSAYTIAEKEPSKAQKAPTAPTATGSRSAMYEAAVA